MKWRLAVAAADASSFVFKPEQMPHPEERGCKNRQTVCSEKETIWGTVGG